MAAALRPGQVLPLARRLDYAPDPAAVFAALCGGEAARDALLLESADDSAGSGGTSLVLVRACLRLEADATAIRLRALTPNGRAALDAVRPVLRECFAPLSDAPGAPDALELRAPPRPAARADDRERLAAPSPLDALRRLVRAFDPVERPLDDPLFAAGLFSYDLVDAFEDLPPGRPAQVELPLLVFWLPELYLRIDHRRGRATAVALVYGADPALYHDAQRALERAVATCAALAPAAPEPAGTVPRAAPDADDLAYASTVRRMRTHIAAGEVFQIVPSRTYSAPCTRPFAAYLRLRRDNPSPYLFHVAHGDWTLFGASPETCVKVDGARQLTLRPIAGTRPRGRTPEGSPDPELDARLEAELRTSAKELAEHVMLVDLARNDVARVSRTGTRRVDRLMAVERYSRVMHLVSSVSGELAPGYDALHAYAASLNMGTLVGAPKLRAAALLREEEPSRRGAYGGAVGYLTGGGELDTAIVIRAALVHGGVARVRAGAGVVALSDPEEEAAETERKARAVLEAIGAGR